MDENIIYKISSELEKGLPGIEVQFEMAPTHRKFLDFDNNNSVPKDSAVLILLYQKKESLHTVFIKRPDYDGHHKNEVSFPGGKYEDQDKDLTITALRETYEEIGINPEEVIVIGKLTPLYIPVSNFNVHPIIGYLKGIPGFVKDDTEVEEIIEADIQSLFDTKNISTKTLNYRKYTIKAPYYNVKDHHIWGATAMILCEFLEIVKRGNIFNF